jgi:hypothetical protein
VNVVTNIVFAGMSGSGIADAAGVGVVLYRMMTRNGAYPPAFAVGLSAAASTIGPIIPPPPERCCFEATRPDPREARPVELRRCGDGVGRADEPRPFPLGCPREGGQRRIQRNRIALHGRQASRQLSVSSRMLDFSSASGGGRRFSAGEGPGEVFQWYTARWAGGEQETRGSRIDAREAPEKVERAAGPTAIAATIAELRPRVDLHHAPPIGLGSLHAIDFPPDGDTLREIGLTRSGEVSRYQRWLRCPALDPGFPSP